MTSIELKALILRCFARKQQNRELQEELNRIANRIEAIKALRKKLDAEAASDEAALRTMR